MQRIHVRPVAESVAVPSAEACSVPATLVPMQNTGAAHTARSACLITFIILKSPENWTNLSPAAVDIVFAAQAGANP